MLPVLLAAAVLVGGANIAAYAANGQPLLLGRFNQEGRTAVVKNNGDGPALDLRSGAGAPSLTVSSSRKVPRLNADRLDGRGAGALETRAWEFRLTTNDLENSWTAPLDVPPGRYLASYQLWVTASSSDGPNCRFRYPDSSTVGFAYPTAKGSTYSTLAGTAILDTRGLSSPVVLDCSQLSDSQVYDGSTPSTVSLVELDRVRLRSVRTR